jgi:thiamine monophosphate synthase
MPAHLHPKRKKMKIKISIKREKKQIKELMQAEKMHLAISGYFDDDHIANTIDGLHLGRIDAYTNALAILDHKYPYIKEPQK